MTLPHIICKNEERFISEIESGTLIGYKYFSVEDVCEFSIKYRTCMGAPRGKISVLLGDTLAGKINIEPQSSWHAEKIKIDVPVGVYPLYLWYEGQDHIDLLEIGFGE